MLKFLQTVWPETGNYLVCHPLPKNENGDTLYAQTSFNNIEAAYKTALKFSDDGKDAYFAVGTVNNLGKCAKRAGANIVEFKAFFIDIDCGETKDYPNQSAAIEALKTFITKLNLPKPILVSSGYGWHVYWVLTEPIPADEWWPIAANFKAILNHAGMKADSTRTADRASILRVPDTFNYKNGNKAPVAVKKWSEPCTLEAFATPLKAYMDVNNIQESEHRVTAETDMFLKEFGLESNTSEYRPADFNLILENCQTMRWAVENNASLKYNQWCGVLSIANTCEESEDAIRQLSENHKDYNQSFAENKAKEFKPWRCNSLSAEFSSCEGCEQHKNSPYSLGFPSKLHNIPLIQTLGEPELISVYDGNEENTKESEAYTVDDFICDYPFPYTLNIGGINKVGDEGMPITICQYPIRAVDRVSDYALGEDIAYFKIKLPKDGWKDFKLKLRDAIDTKGGKVCTELAAQGCIIGSKEQKLMGEFMSEYLRHIINNAAAAKSYAQLGWVDDGELFILNDKCVKKDGTTITSGMSSTVAPIAKALRKKGTLEDWLKVINVYARDGYEPYAFGHSVAYGSLLFRFTDYAGAVISLLGNSGSGKSTVLRTINSVFGNPQELMLQQRDNEVAKFIQIAAMNNIAPCYDEISNIDPKELSDLCYSISQGRDKRRGAQNGGLRNEELTWCCIMPVTSNHSLYERLGTLKSDASAEAMRVFEYHIRTEMQLMSKREAQDTFEPLSDNYGHAGEIFVSWLIQNQDKARERVKYWFNRFDSECNSPNKERYWSAVIGATIAGAEMSANLGLNKFNPEKLFQFAITQVMTARNAVSENRRSALSLLVDFMNSHIRSTIVLGGGAVERGKESPVWVKQEPTNGLIIRVEIDKNIAYISRAAIRQWVTDGGGDYAGMRSELMSRKIILNEKIDKVLSSGSGNTKTGQLPCWLVDLNHRDMSGGVSLQVVNMKNVEKDQKVVANDKPF